MEHILAYRKEVEAALESYPFPEAPEELYAPIAYILSLGGKKLRAILTLLACEAFGTERTRAMQAAIAVEAFHNFTLIHDDIMDEAPLRRGFPTVHTKWDNTTALLSGDALMILSYQMLGQYDPQTFSTLFQIFNRTALEVCEGQQMDINFESASSITEEQYIEMIRLKTAVLVGCALQLGAIVGGAAARDQKAIYAFGTNLGIAFQLQDDYLDTFGDPATFGKQTGGDIIENKKTLLYLVAMQQLEVDDRNTLKRWYTVEMRTPEEKIREVKDLFVKAGADKALKSAIKTYTDRALKQLDLMQIGSESSRLLQEFSTWLMTRNV